METLVTSQSTTDIEYAIEINHLTKVFGPHTILSDLTFNIPRNKITTILGFSGAGKSTLLKHILGLTLPTSGTIKVLGRNLADLSGFELREFRRNLGMVFQYAALFDSMSAYENVAFPMREFFKYSPSELDRLVQELLTAVNLKPESFYKLPSELSGGMRKRVGLARALALSPDIMLYDEPTTGLDPMTTRTVNQLIVDTAVRNADRKMTSVIISHDVKATVEISDYIAFLDTGKIMEYLPTQEFLKSTNPFVRRFLELEGF